MSDAVSMEFDQRQVDALFRQIEAAQRLLNYDIGRAVGAAARSLLASLSASTRIAPKQRKITEVSEVQPSQRGLHVFDIEGYFGKPRKHGVKRVQSHSLETARRRYAMIRNRGLAKLTWKSAASALKLSILDALGASAGDAAKKAPRYVATQSKFSGMESFVLIRNRLDYIEQAMQNGSRSVDTAMQRAADGMEHSIEKQLVKRMGLGSLSR